MAGGNWRRRASIFLPAGCRLCEQLLTRATRLPFAAIAWHHLCASQDVFCELCGIALDLPLTREQEGDSPSQDGTLCLTMPRRTTPLDWARSFVRYEDSLLRAIGSLKSEEMRPLAVWFAERLAKVVLLHVPRHQRLVPLHPDRRRERGSSRAELPSKRLAKRLKFPPEGVVLLVRKRPRPDKHLVTSRERRSRFVALLPHIQAAKLTIDASYW